MSETEWIEIGHVMGDTGPKGDTGLGTVIKGSYDSYTDLIADHPTGRRGFIHYRRRIVLLEH